MSKHNTESAIKDYKLISRTRFPKCCIVCMHVDMEDYWEFACNNLANDKGFRPSVDFNGYCEQFELGDFDDHSRI